MLFLPQSEPRIGRTAFKYSHIKLHVWHQAMFLLCSSKDGLSSHQLERTLGVTVKTVWFMSHRLHEAMTAANLPPMGGDGKTVEVDDTCIDTEYRKPKSARGYAHENAVRTMVQHGGAARAFYVDGTKGVDLVKIINANVDFATHNMMDKRASMQLSVGIRGRCSP